MVMELVSKYIREQKRYTKKELRRIFSLDEIGIEKFLKSLKAYGVLKCVENSNKQLEMSDLVDEDIEIADVTVGSDECLYVFTYVGIITLGNRIIKIYPKYLLSADDNPITEMKQVLKVLDKYSHSQEQIINFFNGEDENRSFNILAVIIFLMRDYYDYGVYSNSEDIVEVNGDGQILWNKTIDEVFPIIEKNRPYYAELYTERTVDDDLDYFKRLHEAVITDCSKMLHLSQIDELFDMDEISLTEERIRDFGEKEYILDRIQKELNIQFNTRKQVLLKTIYAYIAQDRKLLDEDNGISMFGTNAFHAVWEAVCAEAFDNKLKTPLEQLPLRTGVADGYNPNQNLIDVIEKPIWVEAEGEEKEASDTLIPDLISFATLEGVDYFLIFDAKYYNIQLERNKPLRGNPGVSDVTKQYLYQLAYKNFIEAHGIARVRNFFIMPTEKDHIVYKGVAKFEMLSALGLENIKVYQIPAMMVYDCYLSKKKIDYSMLDITDVDN